MEATEAFLRESAIDIRCLNNPRPVWPSNVVRSIRAFRRATPLALLAGLAFSCGDRDQSNGVFGMGGSSGASTDNSTASGPGDSASNGVISSSEGDGTTDGGSDTSGGSGISDGPSTSSGPNSGPGSSEEGPTSEGPSFDVGSAEAEGGSPVCNPDMEKCGCTAVDILFSVDISGSQQTNLEQMRNQFASFIDVMFDRLPPNIDLHVGITTASMGYSATHTDDFCTFNESAPPGFGGRPPPEQLYVSPTTMMVPGNGTQGRLWEYDGKAFFSANTSDVDRAPIKNWFTGATNEVVNASVNATYGDAELASAAAAWAFHPASRTPGFIRDHGAVTVLFLTGDADHSYYVEDPKVLHGMVVAAKAGCGGDKCIIGAGMLKATCDDPSYFAAFDFLRSFGEEPMWGDISPDPEAWRRVLGDALAQFVADTCASIPPEG